MKYLLMRGANTLVLIVALLILSPNSSAISPTTLSSPYVEDWIEMIVINHFYDERGNLTFDQFLFYDKHPESKELIIREWRLAKGGRKQYTQEEQNKFQDEARAKFMEENKMKVLPDDLISCKFWIPDWIGDPNFVVDDIKKHVILFDTSGGGSYGPTIRKIHFRTNGGETNTQFDPELLNREIVPKERRIPFSNFKPKRVSIVNRPNNDIMVAEENNE